MRLKHVFISEYKNLKNFRMDFDVDNFIEILVGKNGSGKSNLLEALIEIFHHAMSLGMADQIEVFFDYSLQYSINERDILLEWKSQKLFINQKKRKALGKTPFPKNILVYYSGQNVTVGKMIEKYDRRFARNIKDGQVDDVRRLISIGPDYKSLLLSVLLMQNDSCIAKNYLKSVLGIENIGIQKVLHQNDGLSDYNYSRPILKVALQRPIYARGKPNYDMPNQDEENRFWRASGKSRDFLNSLFKCLVEPRGLTLTNGYQSDDTYILHIDILKLCQDNPDFDPLYLFNAFDSLKVLGMLAEITVPISLDKNRVASINDFSDGQFQSVYMFTVAEIFKDVESLILLDEPDAFLHPKWQFDFLRQVCDITNVARKSCHVLMSSHSAATLCNLDEQQMSLLKVENSVPTCFKKSKKEIIHELSESFIQYSEDESKLLIDNVIRLSSKPILFVEGPSDVSILNAAYRKIYSTEEVSILIQDAFDRGFIRTLLARREIFDTYSDKKFFALFDFDDAYNDWRDLGGEYAVNDIGLGLCRKLDDKNAYAFLLPIPNNALKNQVWDDGNPTEKVKPKPHFCIEHVFWDGGKLNEWFRVDPKNGFVKFKGDKHKVRFAKEVVPTLPAACFEAFRPMFEFIKSKCASPSKSA